MVNKEVKASSSMMGVFDDGDCVCGSFVLLSTATGGVEGPGGVVFVPGCGAGAG